MARYEYCISEENLAHIAEKSGYTCSLVIDDIYSRDIEFDEIVSWFDENILGKNRVFKPEFDSSVCVLLTDPTDYMAVRLRWT